MAKFFRLIGVVICAAYFAGSPLIADAQQSSSSVPLYQANALGKIGSSCTQSDYERLRAEYLAQHPNAEERKLTTEAYCQQQDDDFSLFALLRGCGRFIFEAPQCLGAAITTALDSEVHETDTVLLCAYPLCHYRDTPDMPGDHVFIRLNSRCHRNEINFSSGGSWLCGPGVVEREPRPEREYPEVKCHTVNIKKPEALDDDGYCEATEVLACMADRAKSFSPSYCMAGSNCGDFSNFLLWCAGYEPRVQFNLNILNNRGVNPWIVRNYTFSRCCGEDIPVGTELSNEEACRVLQQECMPCPSGQCYKPESGRCEASSGNRLTTRRCRCSGDWSRNSETGKCECPKGSVLHYHQKKDATCVCLDERKVPPARIGLDMDPAECECGEGLITQLDRSCKCPGEDEGRSSWSKVNGCQCSGGTTQQTGSCSCYDEGNRSTWSTAQKSCECLEGYSSHTMPSKDGKPAQLVCCSSEEDFDPSSSPPCTSKKTKQKFAPSWQQGISKQNSN